MEPNKEKPKTRTYIVRLLGKEEIELTIEAEDVDLQEVGNSEHPSVYHYNFFTGDITVASFPINSVYYITSKS